MAYLQAMGSRVMKVNHFHRVMSMPRMQDGAHASSCQDTRQQEPTSKRHADHKNDDHTDRKHRSHRTAPHSNAMHGNAGMPRKVAHREQKSRPRIAPTQP